MALKICPECQNDRFEIIEGSESESACNLSIVQCDICGTVVGFMSEDRKFKVKPEKLSRIVFQEMINSKLHLMNSNFRRLNHFMQTLDRRIGHLEERKEHEYGH